MESDILCDYCGKREAHEDYMNTCDPYMSELYPDEVTDEDYMNWCEYCYADRGDAV